jgi:hypothetical protein
MIDLHKDGGHTFVLVEIIGIVAQQFRLSYATISAPIEQEDQQRRYNGKKGCNSLLIPIRSED